MSNIIKVRFTKGIMAITEPQYQYNYGQILSFEGVDLPTAYQVHFSNQRLGFSTTVIGNAEGAMVPDQLFRPGLNIYAWIYLHEGLDDGETVYQVMIPVRARAAITDEEPTQEEQSTISQIIEALNDAVDKAEGAVSKYPTIVNGYWYVWDPENEEWLSTNVKAQGEQGVQGIQGLKGDKGQKGDKGDNGSDGDDYILTESDKAQIADLVELPFETWTFTLSDSTTVTKKVVITS